MKLSPLEIINKYPSLQLGLKYIVNTNSANNAPYHNLNHLITVMKHCYYALDLLGMKDDTKTEPLLLAALFHDYEHSGGELTDTLNVARAWEGFRNFLIEFHPLGVQPLDIKTDDYNFMKNLIISTEYPHTIKNKDLTIYQAILRDADMCQTFEPSWFTSDIYGLAKEFKKPIEQFVDESKLFLLNLKMCTPYGDMIYNKNLIETIKEYELLKNILSPDENPTDETILTWYMYGFNDELKGTSRTISDSKLLNKAYSVGAIDALVGDNLKSSDNQSEEEIIKIIRG